MDHTIKHSIQKAAITTTSLALAILTTATPIFAASQSFTGGTGSANRVITGDILPNYTVTIPDTATLNQRTDITYTVTVSGDVSDEDTVVVTPDSTLTLAHSNKTDSSVATVTQESKFIGSAVKTSGGKSNTGTLAINTATPALKAGQYKGTLHFNIGFTDVKLA